MLSVPPPKRGAAGAVEMEMMVVLVMCWVAMWLRRMELGSSRMAWVMEPAAMNAVRSCGMRGVAWAVAVWLGKCCLAPPLMKKGVMSTGGMVGGPVMSVDVPWAMMVTPWGMEAMRVRVEPRWGAVVLGTIIQRPGSTWMPVGCAGSVTSFTVWR